MLGGQGPYTYAWAVDGETVVGADDETFEVEGEMLGSVISVTVTDADGHEATDATHPVYDSLALLDADQTGAKEVALTANGPITALDKLTVKKGNNEVKIDSVSYEADGAVITLADKIVADATYTVTLTPEDGSDATSVTFTGEKAHLDRIEFLNNVLVMADNTYRKGYAFAKGYDQFDGPVNLTGLTVTPGVGTFTKYDNDTGRITIEDQTGGPTGAFLLVKEVPVFAQYQDGNNVITAQATLSVSNQAFVSEVEFGEIAKDGGEMRPDGRLTILELQSGKYYVPFETIKDQYGNDMDADTLNAQRTGGAANNKTLFVIPDAQGAFFSTGNFATIGGKTVLRIGATATAKPGTMNLTLVGAGGATFEKEITVDDNPFIEQLSVSYPDLYENDTKTETLEFTAIDQYGEEIDLWDFKPTVKRTQVAKDTLEFDDLNSMTQTKTKIVASGATFNDVDYDYAAKKFKVTMSVTGAKRTLATFTTTTAGMKVSTISLTIGERGTAGKVKSALSGGDTQLVYASMGKNSALNFNKCVQFEDANGNTMVRGESDDYPQFLGGFTAGNKLLTYDSRLTTYDKFYWTLSKSKVNAAAATGGALTQPEINAMLLDPNGEVARTELGLLESSADYYVTLYAAVSTAPTTYYIVDDQDFHLTTVQGTDKSWTVALTDTLYTNKEYSDSVGVKVTATTDQGESYTVADDRVKVTSGLFATTKNSISGLRDPNPNPTPGTENVTVYVDDEPQDSVTLNYTNDAPVAKSAWAKFQTTTEVENGGNPVTKTLVGKDFDGSLSATRLTLQGTGAGVAYPASVTVDGGKLAIVNANGLLDTVTMGVDEQYGNTMTDTKFYLDGKVMTPATAKIEVGEHTLEARNGAQSKMIYLTVKDHDVTTAVTPSPVSAEVKTLAQLKNALADAASDLTVANTITLADDISLDAANMVIPTNTTVVLPAGITLKQGGAGVVQNSGTMKIAGTLDATLADAGDLVGTGKYVLNGTSATNATNLGVLATACTSAATIELATSTALSANTVMTNATGKFVVSSGVTLSDAGNQNFTAIGLDNAGTITLDGTGTHDISGAKNTGAMTLAGTNTLGAIDSTGSLTVGAATIDNGAKLAGTINVTTGLTGAADGATISVAPAATITKLLVAPSQTAGHTLVVNDGTAANKITITEHATDSDPATAVTETAITGAKAYRAKAGKFVTIGTNGTALTYSAAAD